MENIKNYNNLKHLNKFSGFPKRRKIPPTSSHLTSWSDVQTQTHRLLLVVSFQASHSIRTKNRPKNLSAFWTATIFRLDLQLDHRPTRRAPTTASASRARFSLADFHQTSTKVSLRKSWFEGPSGSSNIQQKPALLNFRKDFRNFCHELLCSL